MTERNCKRVKRPWPQQRGNEIEVHRDNDAIPVNDRRKIGESPKGGGEKKTGSRVNFLSREGAVQNNRGGWKDKKNGGFKTCRGRQKGLGNFCQSLGRGVDKQGNGQ